MSRVWTEAEYATLVALAPNWPRAARILHRSVSACRNRYTAPPPFRSAAPSLEDQRSLMALLMLGQAAGLTTTETIEYFHYLSRHQGSSWRIDGRYVRTGSWEAS